MSQQNFIESLRTLGLANKRKLSLNESNEIHGREPRHLLGKFGYKNQ